MAQPKVLQAIKLEEHGSGTLLKNDCLSYHLKQLQANAASGNWAEDKRTVSGLQALQLEFYIHFLPLKSVVWGFLVIQWLRSHLSCCRGHRSLKIPHAAG